MFSIENNKNWVKQKLDLDPNFFADLASEHKPEFLWIGCSDSRVPADQITNTKPGQIFVHRNIANLVVHTDINLLSVLHYAVDVLKVKHVIVCGHYECGGIAAAMSNKSFGFIDNWLTNIKDVYRLYQAELDAIPSIRERQRRLVEISVIEQVNNLSKTSVIQEAWKRNNMPVLHGWVYDVGDGLIHDLNVMRSDTNEVQNIYIFD
jgi:carbonic anhydrase